MFAHPISLLFLFSCIDNYSYLILSSGSNRLLRPKSAWLPTGMPWPYLPVNNGVLLLVHINNNGFIFHSTSPVTTKLDRNVEKYTLVFANRWWWRHVETIYGFISCSTSVVTTKIGMIVDQHAIALGSSWR